jgi:uncharacterized protein YukE
VRNFDLHAGAGKLEQALKLFRTTFTSVEQQWTDAARREFQETYVAPMEPNVSNFLDAVSRLAEVLAAAERDCNPPEDQ